MSILPDVKTALNQKIMLQVNQYGSRYYINSTKALNVTNNLQNSFSGN